MYQVASRLFNMQRMEEALSVFVLLTTINNFVFEPWLGLGSCWLTKQRHTEALHAFTMASLLNYNHPAPHIYAAECYLGLNNNKLAQETLELALKLMDKTQQTEFKSHIDYIKNKLKNK
jgi:tetratricopeptide (TPR) repeat protein